MGETYVPSNGYSISVTKEVGDGVEIIGIARKIEGGDRFAVFRGTNSFINNQEPSFLVGSELLAYQLIQAASTEIAQEIYEESLKPKV